MQKVGLDAAHETFRARAPGVEIHRHLKFFLKEKLEIHESGESRTVSELDQEISILGTRLVSSGRTKEPQIQDSHGPEFLLGFMDFAND
jgi:hypothetical protein